MNISIRIAAAVMVAICLLGAYALAEDGLLAHYKFDEGAGRLARDSSGNGRHARIRGCLFVRGPSGTCMDFNGAGKKSERTQHLVCGELDITGELTLSAWVYAYKWIDNEWSGIIYKSDQTYGIRNLASDPGRIHFRVTGRNLCSKSHLEPGRWYHLAAVYKPGQYMRLYINGILDNEKTSEIPARLSTDDAPLLVGACGRSYFEGRMDGVRIYGRALSAEEVSHIMATDGGGNLAAATPLAKAGATMAQLGDGDPQVRVFRAGGMELKWKGETYRISSVFSAPGGRRNCLSSRRGAKKQEPCWKPRLLRNEADGMALAAHGESYALTRRITFSAEKIRVADTIRNTSNRDIGIIFTHQFTVPGILKDWHLYGVEKGTDALDGRTPAINPTCFIRSNKGAVGIAVEDAVFRDQLESKVSAGVGSISMGSRHFGLAAGKSYTLSFSLYPCIGDYFEFINFLRRDWGVPKVTIPGPSGFFYRTASWASSFFREMAANPEKHKEYLARKKATLFALAPWYRYWDGFDFTDEEYVKAMKHAMKILKEVQPDARFLACLETYYYFLPRAMLKDTVPQTWGEWKKMPYEFALPEKARALLDRTPWADSLWRTSKGLPLASRGDPGSDKEYKTPPLCMLVYPQDGNYFARLRMKEINWLLDDVGFDGVYMDMFGYGRNFTYDNWDGHTVDIDGNGELVQKYTSLALVTAPARQAWLKAILAKGKFAIVNFGQPTTAELQRLPYLSFLEGANIGHCDLTADIPDSSAAAGAQLTTPLVLGHAKDIDAERMYARVRAYLRYGALYLHYAQRRHFPSEGKGSGEYGPLNHMYPITPLRLFKGGVEGKERVITTVSKRFICKDRRPLRILLFDRVGRDKAHTLTPRKTDAGWEVEVKLDDWNDIAIIEK